MKKSLFNFTTGDKSFEQGHIYADAETIGCDPAKFVEADEKAQVEIVEKKIEITKPELDSEIK